GRALAELAAAFPRSRFVGIDISEEAIDAARRAARLRGLDNLAFELRDAAELRDEARFDVVTAFDAIHEQARPTAVLAAIARALRPDGVFLMQDVAGTGQVHLDAGRPLAPFLYAVSCLHALTVSLARGGEGLGAMWGEEAARRMLCDAGFGDVVVNAFPHDDLHRYYVARKCVSRSSLSRAVAAA
ncbi:MAG: class I SAM-dependent methyltransferase, partial [Myxococcales bacterium]|nr:class I SAM-dependent methyltransferase [Myxococcales bacterium]